MTTNAMAAYRDHAARTASNEQVLVMLYDALVTDLDIAAQAIAERDFERCSNSLIHAQDILRVLRGALQADAFEGGRQLLELYLFLERHLVQANVTKDAAAVRAAARIVEPLRAAWHQAVAQVERGVA